MHKTINGSAHAIDLPSESVHAIICSPPFFNLRAYHGDQLVDWQAMTYAPMVGMQPITIPAWRGSLGNEPTADMFIGHLILCLRSWHKVLRSDGTCFVNLGDSYASNPASGGEQSSKLTGGEHKRTPISNQYRRPPGLKPKDLCLVPERFRLAAQADGWWVRSEFPWIKANGMPNSQQDRPTTTHESWVMLTKSAQYFWDQEAIKVGSTGQAASFRRDSKDHLIPNQSAVQHRMDRDDTIDTGKRFRRTADWAFESLDLAAEATADYLAHLQSVIDSQGLLLNEDGDPIMMAVNLAGYAGAHFATFPEKLVEPLVKASTSARGCCPNCGSPYERKISSKSSGSYLGNTNGREGLMRNDLAKHAGRIGGTQTQTTGWQPTCTCNAGDPIPATILDPFAGSGTTLRVALRLGRHAIGVDISDVYLKEHVEDRVSNLQFEMAF